MGCEVVVAGASPVELARIQALFERRDAVFSRFRAESELSLVNSGPRKVTVSCLFAEMVDTALWASRETGGLVDPTLGGAVEAAGYERDFAALTDDGPPGEPAPARPESIRLVGNVLLRAAGVRLDLNGVVKAAAVDDAVALLAGSGFVSAGGDLAARGEVDVAVPGGATVRLVSGALATSGRTRRRWLRGGEEQHHLIDPASGRPFWGPWEQVTVCGATCLAADVAAKAAYLLGDDGPDWLDERDIPGRFVLAKIAYENASWRRSLTREAACT